MVRSVRREAGRQVVSAATGAGEDLVIRRSARVVALFSFAALGGCNEQPPEPAPSLPPLAKQQLALSSWKAANPDLQDRLLLAHAIAQGKTEAMVMVATEIGGAASVASAIAALSGDVRV